MKKQLDSNSVIFCALCVIVFLGFLFRLYLALLNMDFLVNSGLIQDDAYYYYVIARNIVANGVSSFDGVHLTNGFHPLWEVFSVAVFSVVDGDNAVRAMLVLGSLFDVGSLFILFLLLNTALKNKFIVLLGVSILAFHGAMVRTIFNGLETSLSIFTLLLLMYYFLPLYLKEERTKLKYKDLKHHAFLGLLAALTFLARTDAAIIIVVMFSFLYVPQALKGKVKKGLLASFVLLVVASPWLLWSYSNFDSIVQISGQVNTDNGSHAFYEEVLLGVWSARFPVGNLFKKIFIPVNASFWQGYWFLFFLLVATLIARKKDKAFTKKLVIFKPLFTGVIILFLYHSGVRQFIRGWYNAPVMICVLILCCLLLDSFVNYLNNKNFRLFSSLDVGFTLSAGALIFLLVFYSPARYLKNTDHPQRERGMAAAEWINENTPKDALVGAGNAGVMGFYTQRPVVNLDGVVNEQAFRAKQRGELHRFISETGIDYLADHKGSIAHFCSENQFYTCEEVKNFYQSTYVMKVVKKIAKR